MTTAAARASARVSRTFSASELTGSRGATRIRFALAVVFGAAGLALSVSALAIGKLPSWPHVVMVMLAAALVSGRGGAFVRDWGPVVLGMLAYTQVAQLAERLHFAVHYAPQIDADRILGFGTLPTAWLQDHLYSGKTGVLEVVSLAAYASHFFVPFGVAFYIWWSRGREAVFNSLILGLLVVSVLAEITFVLAPTAPPWLAAENGHIAHVHQILKQALADAHLHALASLKGDPHAYNIVAAVPSLHVAWPIIGLLVARAYGLPRWLFALQAVQLAAVVFAVVYTGEHYLADAIAGGLYAFVAWRVVERATSARRQPRPRRVRALAQEGGQALFEYAAVLSIVSIVAVGVLGAIGTKVDVSFLPLLSAF
jgi:Flp pilus assembly pilin Flp